MNLLKTEKQSAQKKRRINNHNISILKDEKSGLASILIDGKSHYNEFVLKRNNVYKRDKDILTVWFNAWKYENEKHLAVVPLLRTIKIRLENDRDSKTGIRWANVATSLEKTFQAFVDSTNINLGLDKFGSTQINLSKLTDS